MKTISLITFSFLTTATCFGQEKPRVVLETEGHTANIKYLEFTQDGKGLISASDDKTARVWDLESGILVNVLRGEIDDDNYGMLNSGAIWPNKNIVSVGGFLGPSGEALGKVRFYNYITGELIFTGRGPEGSVVCQSYSKDEKFLAAGTTNGEIAIWNLETLYPVSLKGHDDGVYGVAFSPDGNKLLTASYDKKAILWDIRILKDTTKALDYKLIEDHTDAIRTAAFDPKGNYFLTAGYDNRVLMYDADGNFKKEVIKITDPVYDEKYSFGDIHGIAISDDGKLVAIATGLSNHENVWVVDVATGKKVFSFKEHDNTVIAIDFFGNDMVASAGGDHRDIYVYNIKTGDVKSHFRGKGERVYSVAIGENNQIGYGNKAVGMEERTANNFGEPDMVFDIDQLSVYPMNDNSKFKKAVSTNTDQISIISNGNNLYLANADMEALAEAKLDPNADGLIRCYTFTDDGNVAVGTTYKIILYDNQLKRLRNLSGHTAEIYSLASKDNYLVSGSADQTIRIWDLKDEGKYERTPDEFKEYLLGLGVTEEKLKSYLENNGLTFEKLYYDSHSKKVTPLATLFAGAKDWIIYDNENYYATSKNGSRLVGFHMNQGYDKSAKFHSFRQYDINLNRPEKILEKFNSENKQLIAASIQARKKRIERSGFNLNENSNIGVAPELTLDNIPEVVREEKYKLRFKLSGDHLFRLHVYVNGVPVEIMGGNDLTFLNKENTQTFMVYQCNFALVPGKNHIEIWASDKNGITSTVESVNVSYEPETKVKPDLYIVTIGVSEYSDKNFNLSYAAKDASDISDFFNNSKLYNKINTLKLSNTEFKKDKISSIADFIASSRNTDHVIVFYAGHGVFDQKFDYYLSTHDMDFSDPAKNGVLYTELENLLSKINARNKLLLMDACHSGEIDKDEVILAQASVTSNTNVKFRNSGSGVEYKSGLGISSFTLMKNLFTEMNDKTGATIISSAGGMEFAMEGSEWKNGLFTFALLNGLKKFESDSNGDATISVGELNNYVQKTVAELSGGKQVPTSRNENPDTDFIIWKK